MPDTSVRICHNPLSILAVTSPSPEQILVSITEQGRPSWQQQNIPCVLQALGSSRNFWAGCCETLASPSQSFLLRLGQGFAEGWASRVAPRMSRQPGAAPHMDSASPPPVWLSEGEAAQGSPGAQHHSWSRAQDQAGPGLASQLVSHTVCECQGRCSPPRDYPVFVCPVCGTEAAAACQGVCLCVLRALSSTTAFGMLCLSQGAVSCCPEERKALSWSCAGEELQAAAG